MVLILGTIRSWLETDRGELEDYEVKEYVLERRRPDPNPRVATYDESMTPAEVMSHDNLQAGEYVLQEIKETGTAGDVIWKEELPTNE